MQAKFLLPFLIAGVLATPIAAEDTNVSLKARASAYNWQTGNFFRDKKGNPSVRTRPANPPPRGSTGGGKPTADWPKGKKLRSKRNIGENEQHESAAEDPQQLEARASAYNWQTGNFFRDKKGNPSVRTRPANPPPRGSTGGGKPTADWPKGRKLHSKRNIGEKEQ